MNLIFAKTRWHYDSYTDFWELVRLSGFPTCHIDDMDIHNPEHVYVVAPMNGEWKPYLEANNFENRKAQLYLWNLERPGGSGSLWQYINDNRALIDTGYFDNILVSDRALARDTGFHFVPLGSHAGLVQNVPGMMYNKMYDFIHLSCYSNHRSFMFEVPSRPKAKLGALSIAPNGWGDIRAINLHASKAMLNIHQDEHNYCEPLRFALATAYRLPIVSEWCIDAWPYAIVPFMRASKPEHLIQEALTFIKNYNSEKDYWRAETEVAYLRHTDQFSFRNCVEDYLVTAL